MPTFRQPPSYIPSSWRHANAVEMTTDDFNLYQDEHMPTSVSNSRARTPDPYSFTVIFDALRGRFVLTPPALNDQARPNYGAAWEPEVAAINPLSLDRLFRRGLEFVATSRDSTNNPNWNLWPRRNSLHYKALMDMAHGNHAAFAELEAAPRFSYIRKLWKQIITNPTHAETSVKLEAIINYLSARGPYELGSIRFRAINEKIQNLLEKHTGIKFVMPTSSYYLCHPDLLSPVHNVLKSADTNFSAGLHVLSILKGAAFDECDECKNNFIRDLICNLPGDKAFCLDCADEKGFYRCQECSGRTYHHREATCPNAQPRLIGRIHSYNVDVTKLIPQLFSMGGGHSSKLLRYGVELEVLCKDSIRLQDAASITGKNFARYAILKADSSIGANGFEIVTAPASLNFHRKVLWNDFFNVNNYNNKPTSSLLQSWKTGVCGLHVHITRAALTKMQLAKLLVFYHEETNGAFLSKIAGRMVGPGAHYCKTAKKKLRANVEGDCYDHHDAITISSRNRGKTAEVRIFRGNVTRHGVMRALEFVDATVKWCAHAGASDLSYRAFLGWFDQPQIRATYSDLWRHLIQLGYLSTQHKSNGKDVFELVPETERIA